MQYPIISRGEFLRFCTVAFSSLAARFQPVILPPGEGKKYVGFGRVTISLIYIYSTPDFQSEKVDVLRRDDIVLLLDEITSEHGFPRNKRWYQVKKGYIHSTYIQRVVSYPFNKPLASIPAKKILAEVTVPFTQSLRYNRSDGWQPLYRLYYHSIHWIEGIDEGPDGKPWYRLRDDRLYVDYHVPAAHLRPISPNEYAPIAVDVPPEEKNLIVSIEEQNLTALEGERVVFQTPVSTGLHSKRVPTGELPTDTPLGVFRVGAKMPCRHMGDGVLTSQVGAYELPGVPWTMIFHETGVALHGTYWHDNFGMRMSHGCVNLPNPAALWLFRWTDPVYQIGEWYTGGRGTFVTVI